MNRGGYP